MNGSILYKKEAVAQALTELETYQRELAQVEEQIEEAILQIQRADGFPEVENENTELNIRNPQIITMECQENINNLITNITSRQKVIESYQKPIKERDQTLTATEVTPLSTTSTSKVSTNIAADPGLTGTDIGAIGGIVGAGAAAIISQIGNNDDEILEEEEKKEEEIKKTED